MLMAHSALRVNTRHGFSGDPRGIALIGVDDGTPQLDDSVANYRIDHLPRSPALSIKLGEHALADRIIALRGRRDFGRNASCCWRSSNMIAPPISRPAAWWGSSGPTESGSRHS
jgi:hypothetical protein